MYVIVVLHDGVPTSARGPFRHEEAIKWLEDRFFENVEYNEYKYGLNDDRVFLMPCIP